MLSLVKNTELEAPVTGQQKVHSCLALKLLSLKASSVFTASNLVGMGVLPLQFTNGQSWKTLGITGRETFDITGLSNDVQPGQSVKVTATREDGTSFEFPAIVRLDSLVDVDYYRNGGILQTVLRSILAEKN